MSEIVLHKIRRGIKPYTLLANQSTLDHCEKELKETEQLTKAIANQEQWQANGGMERLYKSYLALRFCPYLAATCTHALYYKLKQAQPSELYAEWKLLLSIAVWAILKIGKPLGGKEGMIEVFSGKTKNLDELLRKNGSSAARGATCSNYAGIIEYLLKQRKVKGETVNQKFYGKTGHRYFVSASGLVIDPMWGRAESGVFTYEEYVSRFPQYKPAAKQKIIQCACAVKHEKQNTNNFNGLLLKED